MSDNAKTGEGLEKGSDAGVVTNEVLKKSLDTLESVVNTSAPARKDILLEKAKSEELSTEEREELFKALGGEDKSPSEPMAKSLDPEANSELGDTFDVTGYLAELHKGFQSYAEQLVERFEKSDGRRDELSLVLCKAVSDSTKALIHQSELVKSLEAKVEAWGKTPATGRRSVSTQVQALEKSHAGSPEAGMQLNKAQIADALVDMGRESMEKGNKGFARCGEDLAQATAKFEQLSEISPALMREVVGYVRNRAS